MLQVSGYWEQRNMAFDYDLVILGGTIAARRLAAMATAWNARVALIEPEPRDNLCTRSLYRAALTEIGHQMQTLRQTSAIYTRWQTQHRLEDPMRVDWGEVHQWARAIAATLEEPNAPATLAAAGVDVIVGQGEFCRRPRLGVVVNGRTLRSRRYLIATGTRTVVPPIEGMSRMNLPTPEGLDRMLTSALPPSHLIILGEGTTAIELAQTFNRLGTCVTLVVSALRLLPQEDPTISRLLHAQLEVEGIRILTQTVVTQVRALEKKKWIQAGTQALEADEILLATPAEPDVAYLNLEGVGVACSPKGIAINRAFQTTNRLIYAWGEGIGQDDCTALAICPATVLRNVLFFPFWRTSPQPPSWAIATDPPIQRLGLTQPQAQQRYGKQVIVVQESLTYLIKPHLQNSLPGFCQLILRTNGVLLGATIMGQGAERLTGAIAWAVYYHKTIIDLARLPAFSTAEAAIMQQCVLQWQRQQFRLHPFWAEVLETWFSWRRN